MTAVTFTVAEPLSASIRPLLAIAPIQKGQVQRGICKFAQALAENDVDLVIVRGDYPNEQAWTEGIPFTANPRLNAFLDIALPLCNRDLPFTCPA